MPKCRGCDSTWGGLAQAHCSTCHATFMTAGGFDEHRVGGTENRTCRAPLDLGMHKLSGGTFGYSEPNIVALRLARGGRK